MKMLNKNEVESLRAQYPIGARLVLTADLQDLPARLGSSPIAMGTRGTCRGVDDAGQIMMAWGTNRSLSLIIGEDSFRKLTRRELIIEDVNKVRFCGHAPNMFDYKAVFELAVELGCEYLPDFLFAHKDLWGAFVLTGELPAEIDTEEVL